MTKELFDTEYQLFCLAKGKFQELLDLGLVNDETYNKLSEDSNDRFCNFLVSNDVILDDVFYAVFDDLYDIQYRDIQIYNATRKMI